ncbi:MAG: PTS glucose transporter subunit IIA [Collinsella sp.]
MGFFSRLMGGSDEQKTAASEFEILAPVSGELVHLENTNDPAFSSRAVGDGVAVVPQEGTVCAPISGTVAALFPTEHALGIMSDDSSAQVMLHIGIDTVKLEGKGFHALVAQGDHVDAGQPSSRSISTRSAPPASIHGLRYRVRALGELDSS